MARWARGFDPSAWCKLTANLLTTTVRSSRAFGEELWIGAWLTASTNFFNAAISSNRGFAVGARVWRVASCQVTEACWVKGLMKSSTFRATEGFWPLANYLKRLNCEFVPDEVFDGALGLGSSA